LSPREAALIENHEPSAIYFRLGSGIGGGTVYRVIPTDGRSPYILKEYNNLYSRENDLAAFRLIRQEVPLPSDIEVIDPRSAGKKSMISQNILGQTLSSVIGNNDVPMNERERLIKVWNHFIDRTHTTLTRDAHWFDFDNKGKIHTLHLNIYKNGRTVTIWLKPDNAIVDSMDGRIFLIDPH
jgi:hypothetical protein